MVALCHFPPHVHLYRWRRAFCGRSTTNRTFRIRLLVGGLRVSRFSAQKIKADLEKNILLKPYFKPAKKVKLAETGNYNTQEGGSRSLQAQARHGHR